MIKNYNNINFNLNKFLKKINVKKQYIKMLKNKVYLLNSVTEQNYKIIDQYIFLKKEQFFKFDNIVTYTINIFFSRSNTLLHVFDFSGVLKGLYTAGNFAYKGKRKKSRIFVLKSMLNYIILKLKFLRKNPIALHFTNVGFFKF
jgi:hypothetical protein